MARDVTGRRGCGSFGDWSGEINGDCRRRHTGDDLVEKRRARVRRFFPGAFAAPVGMLVKARLADHLCHLSVHHAGDRMIKEQTTAGAIIVNQITQSFRGSAHKEPLRLRFAEALQGL